MVIPFTVHAEQSQTYMQHCTGRALQKTVQATKQTRTTTTTTATSTPKTHTH